VENGVDPRNTDVNGVSPLDKAILHNNIEIQNYLKLVIKEANNGKI